MLELGSVGQVASPAPAPTEAMYSLPASRPSVRAPRFELV